MTAAMKAVAKIDIEKLRADAGKAKAARMEKKAGSTSVATGAMAVVRRLLPTIEGLLDADSKTSWDDIAAALTEQGVRTRAGGPITGKRLSSLVDSVRKQDAARHERMQRRRARKDLPVAEEPRPSRHRRLALSPELTTARSDRDASTGADLEAAIRADAFEKHDFLIKKDIKP